MNSCVRALSLVALSFPHRSNSNVSWPLGAGLFSFKAKCSERATCLVFQLLCQLQQINVHLLSSLNVTTNTNAEGNTQTQTHIYK